MKIAITGASGFIGTALRRALSGHELIALRRGHTAVAPDIMWNPDSGHLSPRDLEGVDAVINLAGENIGAKRWTVTQKARLLESRTRGTALLVRAFERMDRPPSVFLSASAIGYYGANCGDTVLDERAPAGNDFLADLCVEWERAALAASDIGVRVATLRTGIVLDPSGGVLARQLPAFKLGLGGRQGPGTQWMSWITLNDHVRATRFILDNDSVDGPVNLVSPDPVTNAAFAKTLGNALRRPTFLPTPMAPLKALYGSELVTSLLLASQRCQPRRLQQGGFVFEQPTLDSAFASMNIGPSKRSGTHVHSGRER